MRRYAFALLLGLSGSGVLIGLGVWQLQRLEWKQAILAEIEMRIAAEPASLPAAIDPARDQYLPVRVRGTFSGGELRVLASLKQVGAGHRLIAAMRSADGRDILVDRGFLPIEAISRPAGGAASVIGNLHWPDEIDSFTPPPDPVAGLWFARDVAAMAAALGTEPVLVVTRTADPADPALVAIPVDTAHIPNNHLNYAITWFSLAASWLGMTAYLLWRIRQRTA